MEEETKVHGWVKKIRDHGGIVFWDTTAGRVVFKKNELSKEDWELAKRVTKGSSFEVSGILQKYESNKE